MGSGSQAFATSSSCCKRCCKKIRCIGRSSPMAAAWRAGQRKKDSAKLERSAAVPLISRRLVDLEIMDLAFLAARRDRHAYASAGIGATGGPMPAFLIGIDQVAIFAMHNAD